MSTQDQTLDTCGCCEGITQLTPQDLTNLPGLSALAYRVGTHGSFKTSMLATASGPDGIATLTTRHDDDPAIALLDAAATMLDVLTFYQERIANEGFLRTATERASVLELARAIGYELNPGVAASTFLAFEMETAPGAPASAIISVGTKVQSLPGQDEQPQTFETVEHIEARTVWNRLKPQTARLTLPKFGDTELYLQGTTTNLKPGDALLLIGDERKNAPGNENWDFRRITAVKPVPATDPVAAYTVVTLERGLGATTPHTEPARRNPTVYALRLRANLFGYNAPDWRSMPKSVKASYTGFPEDHDFSSVPEWPGFTIADLSDPPSPQPRDSQNIHLDAVYPQILAGSWVVLSIPDSQEVYSVEQATEDARANFTLSAKTTRLVLKGEHLKDIFNGQVRQTQVFAQSEALPMAAQPIPDPLQGDTIVLDQLLLGLPEQRTLIITGKRMRVRLLQKMTLHSADGSQSVPANVGDSLILTQTPVMLPTGPVQWTLTDKNNFTGSVTLDHGVATTNLWQLRPAEANDALVSEVATIKTVLSNSDPTTIVLTAALTYSYDRATVFMYGNVARATHGETRREVLGSGDAAQTFQAFGLKQTPLTYVSAPTASGAQTTLQVRLNDVLWEAAPSLYQLTPRDRDYITRRDDNGKTTVQFGDGINGARVPTGDENVTAVYRTGIGTAGMVKAGQLSLLLTRPLGVQKVTNPLAPTGAADPEDRDRARQNAPFTVLTLDRVVSLKDFEDFAHAFAGIGKAQATVLWNGEKRLVYLTIAAAASTNGIDYSVDPRSTLCQNLRLAIDAARDTVQQLEIASYEPLIFKLEARVLVDPAYIPAKVLATVTTALQQTYAFAPRHFGQAVHESEVLAIIQHVTGVKAAFLDRLYFTGDPIPKPRTLLLARGAIHDVDGKLKPAQLLLVDPNGIMLTEFKP